MSQMLRRPRRWTPDAVYEQFAWCQAELNALTADIEEVFERFARDADIGYRSPAGSEGRGGKYGDDGANNGPTPRAAIRAADKGTDSVTLRFQAFLNGVPQLSSMIQSLSGHARFLCAMDPDAARELAQQAKPQRAAPCANCERMVENTPNDRIRSGRCPACYQWRVRHEGEERPKDQWESDAA